MVSQRIYAAVHTVHVSGTVGSRGAVSRHTTISGRRNSQ